MKKHLLKPIEQIDHSIQKRFLNDKPKKLNHLDMLLKWTPLFTLLALDAWGKQPKDKWKEHLLQAAAAELLLNVTVQPLKYISKRTRPNGTLNSFPSNHTATGCLGSEMLRQEIKDDYPVASYAGYAITASTAVLRLYHNKHWLSDVITGAAIGVLSATFAPRLLDTIIYKTNIQAAV